MQLTESETTKFSKVFDSPSEAFIETLGPHEFAKFIYYLYRRDGLYTPVFVDGPGDGGVDIELHSRDGTLPDLQGVVQCKRYAGHTVSRDEMLVFVVAAKRAKVRRRFYFTLQGFAPGAAREAREGETILFNTLGMRNWILDIQRRERNVTRNIRALPTPDQFPIPIICVANNKGGVGKTTIVGNLAACLATDQRGVLIVDADPQCNLTFWLTDKVGLEASTTLHAVLTKQYPIHALTRPTVEPNIWLLPGSQELGELPGGFDAWSLERQLAYALAELPLFDPPIGYILIDTPPSLGFLTRCALVAAHYLIMPLQLDNFSYTGVKGLLGFVEQIESVQRDYPITILGGVATMADGRVALTRHFEREIPNEAAQHQRMQGRYILPWKFWVGTLRDRAEFPKAVFNHQTVLSLDKGSDASKDIQRVAQEVVTRVYSRTQRQS